LKILPRAAAMDINGLGPQIIAQLIDAGLIHSAADLYTLKKKIS